MTDNNTNNNTHDRKYYLGKIDEQAKLFKLTDDLKYIFGMIDIYETMATTLNNEENLYDIIYNRYAYALCLDYLEIYPENKELLEIKIHFALKLGYIYFIHKEYRNALDCLLEYNNYIANNTIEYNKEIVGKVQLAMGFISESFDQLGIFSSGDNFFDASLDWLIAQYSYDVDDIDLAKNVINLIVKATTRYDNNIDRCKQILEGSIEKIAEIATDNEYHGLVRIVEIFIHIGYAKFLLEYIDKYDNFKDACYNIACLFAQIPQDVKNYQALYTIIVSEFFSELCVTFYDKYGIDYSFFNMWLKALRLVIDYVIINKDDEGQIRLYNHSLVTVPKAIAQVIESSQQYAREKVTGNHEYKLLANGFKNSAEIAEMKLRK